MKIAITGASGLIGAALVSSLRTDGVQVVRLVRRAPRTDDEAQWDPDRHELDPAALRGTDAVVHLAAEPIGVRLWTDEYRQRLRDSRVEGTSTVAEALAAAADRPRLLLSMSAIGFYGDTGEVQVDESAPRGQGLLADIVADWEQATKPAVDAGLRVVTMRTAPVLARHGGLLGPMLPAFRLGVGGRLGSGRQWLSWVALPDLVAAMRFLLASDDLAGPVNISAPEPVRNEEFTKALGRVLHRPTVLPIPGWAIRRIVGEFADEAALASQRVLPRRLEDAGFTFTFPDIDAALRAVL